MSLSVEVFFMNFVNLEIADNIGVVTLDRPPVNAINLQMYDEIKDTFKSINQREDLNVVVLIAKGGKAFVAGNDLNEFLTLTPKNSPERMKKVRESFWAIYDCKYPVIGAVGGAALGTGLAYAAVCDMLIASENAMFGLPEINVGVMGGAMHLSRLVPFSVVRYMHYTGRNLSAQEMRHYGSIIDVVAIDQLRSTAMDLAKEIARKSPKAIEFAKKSLNTIEYNMNLKEGYKYEQSLTNILSGYEDSKEAVRAFFEKRDPVFKGE